MLKIIKLTLIVAVCIINNSYADSQVISAVPIPKANINATDQPSDAVRQRKLSLGTVIDSRFQPYVDEVLNKVSRVAATNSDTINLNGKVRLTIEIWSDGSLNSIEVNKPLTDNRLNDEVIKQIRKAAPFASFPAVLKKQTDVLFLTREWGFNSEGGGKLSLLSPTTIIYVDESRPVKTLDMGRLEFQTGTVYLPNTPSQQKYIDDPTNYRNEYQLYTASCLAKIMQVVEANPISPELKGRVAVNIEIQSDGTIKWIQVVGKSLNKLLDDEVIKRISDAAPFEPLPETIKSKNASFIFTKDFYVNPDIYKAPSSNKPESNPI